MNQNIRIARELVKIAKELSAAYNPQWKNFIVSDIEWDENSLQHTARHKGMSIDELEASLPSEPVTVEINMDATDGTDDSIRGRIRDEIFDIYEVWPTDKYGFDYEEE